MVIVYGGLIAAAVWHLVTGLRSGTMSALGAIYATANRQKQTSRYWHFAIYNMLLIVAGLILLIETLSK